MGFSDQVENLDAKVMKTACEQKPKPGETIKFDFDLFAPASTPTFMSHPAKTEIVTLTSLPLYPSSSPIVISISSTSAMTTFFPTPKGSQTKNVRIGLGTGVGISGVTTILAVICLILLRWRFVKRKKVKEDARACRALEPQGDLEQKSIHNRPAAELPDTCRPVEADGSVIVEADDGQPSELPVPEIQPMKGSPGTFASGGDIEGSSSGRDRPGASTPGGLRASRSGISSRLDSGDGNSELGWGFAVMNEIGYVFEVDK